MKTKVKKKIKLKKKENLLQLQLRPVTKPTIEKLVEFKVAKQNFFLD